MEVIVLGREITWVGGWGGREGLLTIANLHEAHMQN